MYNAGVGKHVEFARCVARVFLSHKPHADSTGRRIELLCSATINFFPLIWIENELFFLIFAEYLELKQEYFNSPIFISPSITVKSKSTPHVFEITKQQQPKLALSDVEKCLVQLIEDTNRKSKNRYIDDGQLPWKIIEETPAIIHFGIYGNEEQNAVFKYERYRLS